VWRGNIFLLELKQLSTKGVTYGMGELKRSWGKGKFGTNQTKWRFTFRSRLGYLWSQSQGSGTLSGDGLFWQSFSHSL